MANTRIYLWSHPRSLSTVFLRSFEQRDDTKTFLEPLLMNYNPNMGPVKDIPTSHFMDLKKQLELQDTHPITFVNEHLFVFETFLDNDNFHDFVMKDAVHTFIIREPQESVLSYSKVKHAPTPFRPEEVLIENYSVLVNKLQSNGSKIIIINATELLKNPTQVLIKYCADCGIPFLETMMNWKVAEEDSVYRTNSDWFGVVADSTGFIKFDEQKALEAANWQNIKFTNVLQRNKVVFRDLQKWFPTYS